jgi:hypothetical protein
MLQPEVAAIFWWVLAAGVVTSLGALLTIGRWRTLGLTLLVLCVISSVVAMGVWAVWLDAPACLGGTRGCESI